MEKRISVGLCLLMGAAAFAREIPGGDGVVDTVEDLRSLFAGHQETYLPVSPPSEEVFVQDYGPAVPFRTANLPKRFLKRMVGELNADLVPVYRLSVYEDPATRETVFLNVATGREMYRLAPAKGYRPLLWQRAHFGRSLDPLAAWIFDPADAEEDCDNDGTSNLDEHNQGTDPGGGSAGGGGSGSGETNVTVDVRLKVGEFRGRPGYVYKMVLDGEQTFRLSSERKGQTKTGTLSDHAYRN